MLSDLIDRRAGYSEAHVLKAIMLLSEMPHGRFLLMKKLSLNEASARTLLTKLQLNGYTKPSAYGNVLTKKGASFVKKIRKKIIGPVSIGKTPLTLSENNIAYIVRNGAKKIGTGLEQRDIAVQLGASGMTTLVYKNGLFIPNANRKVPKCVEKLFSLKENDAVLIGSADVPEKAELAALYAACKITFK